LPFHRLHLQLRPTSKHHYDADLSLALHLVGQLHHPFIRPLAGFDRSFHVALPHDLERHPVCDVPPPDASRTTSGRDGTGAVAGFPLVWSLGISTYHPDRLYLSI